MANLLIALSLEYGAEEYLWYSSFQTENELLTWWKELKTTDIYTHKLEEILDVSELVSVNNQNRLDTFYSCIYSVMLENDPCSYIIINGKRYDFNELS